MTPLPPYISLDANRTSRSEPPARVGRPRHQERHLLKLAAFVALLACGVATLFDLVVY